MGVAQSLWTVISIVQSPMPVSLVVFLAAAILPASDSLPAVMTMSWGGTHIIENCTVAVMEPPGGQTAWELFPSGEVTLNVAPAGLLAVRGGGLSLNVNMNAADVRLVMLSVRVADPAWESWVSPCPDGPVPCILGNEAEYVLVTGPAAAGSTYVAAPTNAVSTSSMPMRFSRLFGWISSPRLGKPDFPI